MRGSPTHDGKLRPAGFQQISLRLSKGIQVNPAALAANPSPAASKHPRAKVRGAADRAAAASQISSFLALITDYF